ncbi:hypothetical protein QN277_022668 [Acacia crassicarpa]|uniref:Uncharacterized protein n=1 Tax=Acacia crassicarpa TaxID=499986 RepID=A0AAE1JIC6_9FABA|nr:hypothetical protein QN277_022668 [Acacia crassicarpa]
MVSTIVMLFLFISYAQAISSTSELQASSISESRALNLSNLQMHQEFLERLWYGSMREKKTLVEIVEKRKNEMSETLRNTHGSGGTGRGRGRGRGSPSGSGTADINRRPYSHRNSATSLLQVPFFGASNLALSVACLAFIFVFLFN